jgi:isopenicillin-N epimerase
VRHVGGVRLLTSDDPSMACAIGTFAIEGFGAQALTDHLQNQYRIHVRPRFVPGEWEGIRVTPNVFTTLGEVDALAEAITRVARHGM